MQRLLAGGAFYRTDTRLTVGVQLICAVCRHQELLAGNKVRRREVDDLGTLWRNGDVGNDQVNLARLQQRNTVRRVSGDQLQLNAEAFRQRFSKVDVIAHDVVRFWIHCAKRRVCIKSGDFHHAC